MEHNKKYKLNLIEGLDKINPFSTELNIISLKQKTVNDALVQLDPLK